MWGIWRYIRYNSGCVEVHRISHVYGVNAEYKNIWEMNIWEIYVCTVQIPYISICRKLAWKEWIVFNQFLWNMTAPVLWKPLEAKCFKATWFKDTYDKSQFLFEKLKHISRLLHKLKIQERFQNHSFPGGEGSVAVEQFLRPADAFSCDGSSMQRRLPRRFDLLCSHINSTPQGGSAPRKVAPKIFP